MLLNGTSTSSVTGSASMSARSATTGPGWPPFSTPTTPVCATFSLHLVEAERAQVVGDDLRGAHLAVAELGVLVDVAAPGDDAGLDRVGGRGDRRIEGEGGVGSVHGR